MTSREHHGSWSPPEKKEVTDWKNWLIFAFTLMFMETENVETEKENNGGLWIRY